jgi:hypothetical protein
VQAEVDAAIKRLQELKLELTEHQKVSWRPLSTIYTLMCMHTAATTSTPICLLLLRPLQPPSAAAADTKYPCLVTWFRAQAFEKVTGKSSSQNKEAFRAALVSCIVQLLLTNAVNPCQPAPY